MKRWLRTVWRMCWKCDGAGLVQGKGELVPMTELQETEPDTWADVMVNGGWVRRTTVEVCTRCSGTGLRKRFR